MPAPRPVAWFRLPLPAARAGTVTLFVAILALILLALIGLAIDKAFVVSTHQQMQRAADAAALAGVRLIPSEIGLGNGYEQSRLTAMAVAHANKAAGDAVELQANAGNDPAGDIVVGYWDAASASFTADTASPNAIRVRVRRSPSAPSGPLPLAFGPVFGTKAVGVGATATAVVGALPEPVVLILDPSGEAALKLNGTALLDATRGLIQVNSADPCAVQLAGTPLVCASKLATCGGICAPDGCVSGLIQPGAPCVDDPLAGVLGDGAAWNALAGALDQPLGPEGAIVAPGNYHPGRYPGGLALTSDGAVTLEPGVYVLGGPGLILHGGASLSGQHVALLVDAGGIVDIRGHATATWSAPEGGPLEGVALFCHRDNTGLAASLGGDGVISIDGTVYVPAGTLRLAGGPDKTVGTLVAHRLEDSGTPSLTVLGPSPEEAEPVTYLVE
ncbi:MAG TPA: TadG family pilus assembly protein [Planctomycetota bacterium]|nr:TadG family pilus assembly protein [Planctomycetota bacterium]